MIASLILRRSAIRTPAPAPVTDPSVAPLLDRLERTLENVDRKRRG